MTPKQTYSATINGYRIVAESSKELIKKIKEYEAKLLEESKQQYLKS